MSLPNILVKNQQWARKKQQKKDDYFLAQSHLLNPKTLWIGCLDSRVCPEKITQAKTGEMLVVRNFANIFQPGQFGNGAILEFAVNMAKVESIVLCGHTQCMGIKHAMSGSAVHDCAKALSTIDALKEKYAIQLASMSTEEQRWRYLCELNVLEQVQAIKNSEALQSANAQGIDIPVYGLLYEIETGLLSEVEEKVSIFE